MDDHFLRNKNGYFNILKQLLFKELIVIFKRQNLFNRGKKYLIWTNNIE